MSRTIFQITTEMVASSSTLTKEDIGLWCFLYNRRYRGFTPTKGEAYVMMANLVE